MVYITILKLMGITDKDFLLIFI